MAIMKGVTTNLGAVQLKSSKKGELEVNANNQPSIQHFSRSGKSYSWRSADTDIDAGDTRLFIKNTGDDFLVITHAVFGPANVVCRWDVGIGSLTTTPTGTVVAAVNLNQNHSTQLPSYLAFDDETAVADATPMLTVATSTVESKEVPLNGIILGKNHYIQINQETESTSGQVTVFGYFADELM